ncbi:MAG: alkaline phosphatase family protein [Promethearchaeota archaeon]
MAGTQKNIIIGLDGATFELIKPWINNGELPIIKSLMEKGTYSTLKSVIPPISAPAWVSFMTGKNPGKHGVFSFIDDMGKLVSSNSFKDETLWEILSFNKIKVGVVNVPITYPPKEVNGFLISGFLSPPNSDFTYPKNLKNEMKGYKIDVDFARNWLFSDNRAPRKVDKEKLIDEQYMVTEKRASTVIDLIKKYDPMFLTIVFKGTDNLQHYFWDRNDILLEYYKKLDEIIKRIIENYDEKSNIFIISDHGFGPSAEKKFHINTWLRDLGLLKTKENLKDLLINKALQLAYRINQKIKLSSMIPEKSVKRAEKQFEQQIDYEKSKAFVVKGSLKGIYTDSNKTREFILEKLSKLKDAETGETIIEKAWKKEDVYFGPYLKDIPDIILLQNPKYAINPFLSKS